LNTFVGYHLTLLKAKNTTIWGNRIQKIMKGRYLLFLILPSIAKLTFDRSDRISFKMVNTFVSIIDIGLSEILFRSCKFYLFDLGLLIQLYSLFFSLLLFVFIGKQKIPDIRSKIKAFYFKCFYSYL
jgi:hypothetical protein